MASGGSGPEAEAWACVFQASARRTAALWAAHSRPVSLGPHAMRSADGSTSHAPPLYALGMWVVCYNVPLGLTHPDPEGPGLSKGGTRSPVAGADNVWCRWSWASREGSGVPLMSGGQPALERGLGRARPKGACGWVFFKAIAVLLADANAGPTGRLALSKGFVCVTFGATQKVLSSFPFYRPGN